MFRVCQASPYEIGSHGARRGRPDFHGLNIRVVGVPIFTDIFRALGANPVSINFAKAQEAFRQGVVDGQENPIALIIPYQLWAVHKYITLWRYAIDPTILAVSAKTWMSFSPEDQKTIRQVGDVMSSNLLACTTGRSAGLAPLRMRPA
jgi:TRAP-type C4-dicarboxylate transport system substrate-binding protein